MRPLKHKPQCGAARSQAQSVPHIHKELQTTHLRHLDFPHIIMHVHHVLHSYVSMHSCRDGLRFVRVYVPALITWQPLQNHISM